MTRRFLLLPLAALLVLIGACGKETSPTTPPAPPKIATSPAPVSNEVTTPELDNVPKARKPYKLALVVKTRNNPFFGPMIGAFEKESKVMGVIGEVQAPPQETDKEQQFAIVQGLVARGIDALLIAPADSKAIVPALKAAQDKGVLVINLDNRVDKDEAARQGLALGGYVGADNEAGGVLAGEAMREALGETGDVAIIEGIRGADNAEARKRGFEKSVAGHLNVVASETANWDTQQAYAKAQAILAAHPTLKGIFCANDKMAIGAMKAVSEAGKKGKIAVVGYDNIPDVRPYLKDRQLYSTIEQHPDLMGKYGVRMAVGVLDGSIPKGKERLVSLERIR